MASRVSKLGLQPYLPVWQDMQRFTDQRNDATEDELWLLQHPPVYTLGKSGKTEHVLDSGDIPVVQSDRGGQVTYHGPGQIIVYTLLDLKRMHIGIRELVTRIENSVIALLDDYAVNACARHDAPGVYVEGKKIAALGLRVRKGCCFHGVALNVDMDLEPFERIDPCGYQDIEVTQLSALVAALDFSQVEEQLLAHLKCQFL
ncbi:MAG: lipoyl(octanoyl) transferase LipB [Gammaproteobacteria bacterium]|nr:lipoyl(octanoyl) transferase LipB [Gammaproteobacteria bacterium]NNJ96700.1 lipoyl(octanoyl) transferase LipB [Gammaproteobacteria bacterium]